MHDVEILISQVKHVSIMGNSRQMEYCIRRAANSHIDGNGVFEGFHDVVIDRRTRRLDDKHVLAADAFVDHYLDFTVVEFTDKGLT